jgi:hypothetical protein
VAGLAMPNGISIDINEAHGHTRGERGRSTPKEYRLLPLRSQRCQKCSLTCAFESEVGFEPTTSDDESVPGLSAGPAQGHRGCSGAGTIHLDPSRTAW